MFRRVLQLSAASPVCVAFLTVGRWDVLLGLAPNHCSDTYPPKAEPFRFRGYEAFPV